VDLSATVRDAEFELLIRDNGVGFDTTRETPGMGLSSLRERARMLGGSVTIDSTPEKGAIITLRAPIAR
jgi:signal transduction histidine kinase